MNLIKKLTKTSLAWQSSSHFLDPMGVQVVGVRRSHGALVSEQLICYIIFVDHAKPPSGKESRLLNQILLMMLINLWGFLIVWSCAAVESPRSDAGFTGPSYPERIQEPLRRFEVGGWGPSEVAIGPGTPRIPCPPPG